MTAIRHLVEVLAVTAISGLVSRTPRRVTLCVGAAIGRLAYWIDARHRRITRENIRLAYGDELSEGEVRRLARASWAHLGRIACDTINLPKLSASSVGSVVHYEGLEHYRAAYAKGKGVLLFSGHFGHWELAAFMQGHLNLPLAVVTRPAENPILEKRLARIRCSSGNVIIHRRGAVREMLKALRAGSGVAIVIDQDARGFGVFVPFFGRPASTTSTLASLALKTGAAIVPVFSIPRPDGSFRVIYEPPVEVQATGDRAADVLRITSQCTAIIERWVRRHPELWMWVYRRWKTAPPPAAPNGPSRHPVA